MSQATVLHSAGNLLAAAHRHMLPALLLRCCRLLYKNDGNAVGRTCWLHIRGLQTDGLHFKGPEKLLIRNDLPWEGAVIEVRHQPQLCCSRVVRAAQVVGKVIEVRAAPVTAVLLRGCEGCTSGGGSH